MKGNQAFRATVTATLIITVVVSVLTIEASVTGQQGGPSKADATKLLYADFQSLQNGRLVSKRGGLTRLNKYAQNMANAPRIRGLENADPPSPAAARVTDQDMAAAFKYELRMPNEWAGVNMEVFVQSTRVGAAFGLEGGRSKEVDLCHNRRLLR